MSNSDFDKNGLDSYGIHWLQYAAFAVSGFAIFTTWAFFYDERFHNFVMNIFRNIRDASRYFFRLEESEMERCLEGGQVGERSRLSDDDMSNSALKLANEEKVITQMIKMYQDV